MSELLNLKWQQVEDDRAFIYALDPTHEVNAFSLQVQPGYVNGKRTTSEQLAEVGNAIVALPELLAAMEAMLTAVSLPRGLCVNDPEINRARAAIAKAKGEPA